eukprot:scaffold89305_cov36-Phaeocystis_antarctica.AAC.1
MLLLTAHLLAHSLTQWAGLPQPDRLRPLQATRAGQAHVHHLWHADVYCAGGPKEDGPRLRGRLVDAGRAHLRDAHGVH